MPEKKISSDILKQLNELAYASDEEVFAEYGRSLSTGAFETDPEGEGRRLLPRLLTAAQAHICSNTIVRDFITGGISYERSHIAAIVCEILMEFVKVTAYSAPSATILCMRHGLKRLCEESRAPSG